MQRNDRMTARPQQLPPAMERFTPQWDEYELVDSGGGRKLERFGKVLLVRPEAQAKWAAAMPKETWEEADIEFVREGIQPGKRKGQPSKGGERQKAFSGQWKFRGSLPARWELQRRELRFWVQPAPSGHLGVFPD